MSASATLLDEAFGTRMMYGVAEWKDVPEVVRSSFYVIHKAFRHYEKRLDRCEHRVAYCMDRQAQIDAELRTWGHIEAKVSTSSGTLNLYRKELECKVDRSVFLSSLNAAIKDISALWTRSTSEKIEAHAQRIDTAITKIKRAISRKLKHVKGTKDAT
jgi:hypothetical protein